MRNPENPPNVVDDGSRINSRKVVPQTLWNSSSSNRHLFKGDLCWETLGKLTLNSSTRNKEPLGTYKLCLDTARKNVGRDSRNDSIFQHSDLVLYRMHTVCGVLVSKHARSDVNLQDKFRAVKLVY